MRNIRNLTRAAVLALLFSSWACSDADDGGGGGGVGPGPGGTVDSVTFFVYTLHADEPDFLRWKGNADGPAPDSPELTSQPFIGFGRPFRVEWKITFETGATEGYQYRASQQDWAPFLPVDGEGNSVWGQTKSFTFANDTSAEALEGESCESGPDCPDRLRFDSGLHRIQVMAIDSTDEEMEASLEFDINYPPETVLPLDSPTGCGDDTLFPLFEFTPASGDPIVCNFAPGDTIPAGSIVTVRMEGFDRLEANVMTDSFCCDTRLDDEEPEVELQGRLDYSGVHVDGTVREIGVPGTPYGSLNAAGLVRFRVGPFGYTFFARAADEHGRRDYTPESFSFAAGFSPRITEVEPGDGDRIILNPHWGDAWVDEGIGTVRYQASVDTTWYWTGREWSPEQGTPLYQPHRGTVFRISMRFAGENDDREPLPAGVEIQKYAGGILSWAYGFLSAGDPDNLVKQGGGIDDARVQLYADSPERNQWIMDGPDAVVVFVPEAFWDNLGFFDPDGDCPIRDWCDMGALLLKELGDITLEVRGKTTPGADWDYCQHPPTEVEGVEDCQMTDRSRYGRYTQKVTRSFSLRLGFADESGDLVSEWPPPIATLRPARARFIR